MCDLTNFKNLVTSKIMEASRLFNIEGEFLLTEIKFDLKGMCAGYAIKHANGRMTLRFNPEAIEKDSNDMINNTIPHEVAHLVCYARPELGKNHNRGWARVDIALGGCGKRTHSIPLTRAKTCNRFIYKVDDGTEVQLSTYRHNQINKGKKVWLLAQHTVSKRQLNIEPKHFVKQVVIK